MTIYLSRFKTNTARSSLVPSCRENSALEQCPKPLLAKIYQGVLLRFNMGSEIVLEYSNQSQGLRRAVDWPGLGSPALANLTRQLRLGESVPESFALGPFQTSPCWSSVCSKPLSLLPYDLGFQDKLHRNSLLICLKSESLHDYAFRLRFVHRGRRLNKMPCTLIGGCPEQSCNALLHFGETSCKVARGHCTL